MAKRQPRALTDPVTEKADCLRVARQFLVASACCTSYEPKSGGSLVMPYVPAVVNAAFAVELAFKALLLKSLSPGDPAPEGHELDVLFQKLSPSHQASLKSTVEAPSYPRLEQPSADPVLDALTWHSKAFVHWRYLHEGQNAHLSASVPFLTSLAEAAVALA